MFRKIWKTLRIFLILAIIAICMPHSLLPRSGKKKDEARESSLSVTQGTPEKKLPSADSLRSDKRQQRPE